MRQILVDHARLHRAAKRGADYRVDLDVSLLVPQAPNVDVIALHDALNGLARLDEQQGRIVEMRFFGGLSTEEVARVLGISPSTVRRDWNVAKGWLFRQIKREHAKEAGARGVKRPLFVVVWTVSAAQEQEQRRQRRPQC